MIKTSEVHMNIQAKWIKTVPNMGEMCPEFRKVFSADKKIVKAEACVTSLGIYHMYINGAKVGDYVMTPGYTSYATRVQFQRYDVTELLCANNTVSVVVGKGWMYSALGTPPRPAVDCSNIAIKASIEITYEDGEVVVVATDDSWEIYTSKVVFSEHYDGDTIDLSADIVKLGNAILDEENKPAVIEQVGEFVAERERMIPTQLIITPKGEKVIDFGQNFAGYVEVRIKGKKGDRVVINHAEVLDKDGNFYNDNLRSAKCCMTYTLSGGEDLLKPMFTFQGFRYIRIDEYPFEEIDINNFTGVAIYSDMTRTGHFVCGNDKLNRLYSNIVWGQRSNFIDIPTDCPQRDERLGWTGDAQVFCRTAAINYDVEKFFRKWLQDVAIEQTPEGGIHGVVPTCGVNGKRIAAAWGDCTTVCSWEMYKAYGDLEMLRANYPMMKKWVEYMHGKGDEEFLWVGTYHYGDWLAMDAGYGVYIGATQTDLIASAFFAYSTAILIKAARTLGLDEDVAHYEELYKNVRAAFREAFMKDGMPVVYPKADGLATDRPVKGVTQTAIALILRFDLCEDNEREALVTRLVELIKEHDGCMTTGFVGTPYILHALSDNGRTDAAYDLLLQEKNPSWLFSVNNGATTVWEHWDSFDANGKMWSTDMNSFNHYAYGAVFDWMFGNMVGIKIRDDGPAYSKIVIEPSPNEGIGFAEASVDTRNGRVFTSWRYIDGRVRYEIELPKNTEAIVRIPGMDEKVLKGGAYVIYK
ncbi:MAG: alfa-L-rhamnosidase [Ruminococcaceae bacterium]|nr:alfa-L-rhamnosidase [Oscillospiraceae bacterium]